MLDENISTDQFRFLGNPHSLGSVGVRNPRGTLKRRTVRSITHLHLVQYGHRLENIVTPEKAVERALALGDAVEGQASAHCPLHFYFIGFAVFALCFFLAKKCLHQCNLGE